MEPEKDVSEYLQEVDINELTNNPLWSSIQDAISQAREVEKVVDMGTDLFLGDSVVAKSDANEQDIAFYLQCMKMLEFSFNNSVVLHPVMQRLFIASLDSYEKLIDEAISTVKNMDSASFRERLSLETVPFLYAKRMRMNFNDIAKDNDIRLSFQALFLFLLRRKLGPKYATMESFLEKYPDLADRSAVEQTRLRNSANWMVITFNTLQPRNNKSFIVHLIPKVVEGKNARYITGSGQTKATADRVNLFRVEGECEKIQRPPRKRKEPTDAASSMLLSIPGMDGGNMSSFLPSHPSLFSYPSPYFPPSAQTLLPTSSLPAASAASSVTSLSQQQQQQYLAAALAVAHQQQQSSASQTLPLSLLDPADASSAALSAALYHQHPATLLALQKHLLTTANSSNNTTTVSSSQSSAAHGAAEVSSAPRMPYLNVFAATTPTSMHLSHASTSTTALPYQHLDERYFDSTAQEQRQGYLHRTLSSHDSLSSSASTSSDNTSQQQQQQQSSSFDAYAQPSDYALSHSKKRSNSNKQSTKRTVVDSADVSAAAAKNASARKQKPTLSRSFSASAIPAVSRETNLLAQPHWLMMSPVTSPLKRAKLGSFPSVPADMSAGSWLDRSLMMQSVHHTHSSSSVGLDALLTAAECLEEHAQFV